jgi:hypothetical protein
MSVFKETIDSLSVGEFKKPHKYIALLSMIFTLRGFKFKVQHPVLGYWRLLKKLHRVS